MTNMLTADRAAILDALRARELKADDSQPASFTPPIVLLNSAEYEPGSSFGAIQATYELYAVAAPAATVPASQTRLDALLAKILDALDETRTGDLSRISPPFNLQTPDGRQYQAATVTITSEITL